MKLTQDFADPKLEVLEEWLRSASEAAQEAEDTWKEAERQVAQLTGNEREAFWTLYKRSEDLIMRQGQRQKTERCSLEREEFQTAAPLIFTRTLIDYEKGKSDLSGALWSLCRRHWRKYFRKTGDRDSEAQRRLRKLLRQLRIVTMNESGRDPTIEEQVDYLLENNHYARRISEERLVDKIRSIERRRPRYSLDRPVEDEDGDGKTLHEVTASPQIGSIDLKQVGRQVAVETNREVLWDALIGEEESSDFSGTEARKIVLELMARDVGTEEIAEEHDTSPFVVQKLYENTQVTEEEARRYAESRYERSVPAVTTIRGAYEAGKGYIAIAADRDLQRDEVKAILKGRGCYDYLEDITDPNFGQDGLPEEVVQEIRRRYQKTDVTFKELAEDYPVFRTTIGSVIRGKNAYSDYDSLTEGGEVIEEETVRAIRREYAEEAPTYSELAEDYAVGRSTVGTIVRGERSYSDLEDLTAHDQKGLDPDTAETIYREYHTSSATQKELGDEHGVSRYVVGRVTRAEGAYSRLADLDLEDEGSDDAS